MIDAHNMKGNKTAACGRKVSD